MLTLTAPAKLNLTLEVLGKRPDGYHEIRSVMQTISLADTLNFKASSTISFKSANADWLPEKSLVAKAAGLLRETAGTAKGALIEVAKSIPLVSGLGGDSSDAAATLRGLSQLWGLNLPREELLKLAAGLGSDVPFFLYGGTVLAAGRGEILTPLPSLPHHWVVLVLPALPRLPDKTKQLYASIKPDDYTDGQITGRLVEVLKRGEGFSPSLLFNVFKSVAFSRFAGLEEYRERMLKLGADNVHLAGSGPTLFSLVKDKTKAEDLYLQCKKQKMETYIAEMIGTKP